MRLLPPLFSAKKAFTAVQDTSSCPELQWPRSQEILKAGGSKDFFISYTAAISWSSSLGSNHKKDQGQGHISFFFFKKPSSSKQGQKTFLHLNKNNLSAWIINTIWSKNKHLRCKWQAGVHLVLCYFGNHVLSRYFSTLSVKSKCINMKICIG